MQFKDRSIEDICGFLAGRIRSERLRTGHTQEQMALKAGISLRTYKRFEQSGRGSVEQLIRMLMVFDRLKVLELFLPPPLASSRQSIVSRFEDLAKKASERRT